MDQARKRQHDQIASDGVDAEPDLESGREQRRRRRTIKYKLSSTFEELNEHHNFVVDTEDILEDYLCTQKLRKIPPLILDITDRTWQSITTYIDNNHRLTPGSNVLLINGIFLRIREILRETDRGHIVLRGHKFIRNARLKPMLDDGEDARELFWDLKRIEGSPESVKDQSLIDVPLRMVERTIQLHLSNCEKSDSAGEEIYYCRWKLTRCYQDTKSERRSTQLAIEKLGPLEADPNFRVPSEILQMHWRGFSIKDLGDNNVYTALDGFCCSGGWSQGATLAGSVKVVRAFDSDEKACRSYRANFPETHCLNTDVFDYCLPQRLSPDMQQLATSPQYVDIAHYSTPCQFFSPAHTRNGRNDEKNIATSFCLAQLLDKDRPRVMTFENTFGLERRHFSHLKAIFGQITSRGYSLRFATLNLADWGIAQDRRRLIMIASCPGETLPTFPAPTHSKEGRIVGTLPWVTMDEAMAGIPFDGWQNHHPRMMRKMTPKPNQDMAETLTCKNRIAHPSGRECTLSEYQSLQGFPLHHRFAKGLSHPVMRSQIGNAFPPIFVKKLIRHIRRHLQRSDNLPETVDEDEFWTAEEMRAREMDQFFKDHETLPIGTRANIVEDDESDMEDILPSRKLGAQDDDDDDDVLVLDSNWITATANQPRDSTMTMSSFSSNSSLSLNLPDFLTYRGFDISQRPGNDRSSSSPESVSNFYDAFDTATDTPRSSLSFSTDASSPLSMSMPFQPRRLTKSDPQLAYAKGDSIDDAIELDD